MSYIITQSNYNEAEAAIRDILFMYRDLIRCYDGFGHNIDVGTFSAFLFVDAGLFEEPGWTLAMDMRLIHEGSCVALICNLYDFWDEHGRVGLNNWAWAKELRVALDQGRLNHLPLAKAALSAGLENGNALCDALPRIYAAYVRGYFERLLQNED